jgi:hypothetical protein
MLSMVLGHSRDSLCALTGSQDLVTFWASHRRAFRHFGGVPEELLCDRTKTVVRAHVGREVTLERRIFHPEALASAHHYGFSMRLCQPYRAKIKGKVEHEVSYVRERRLRGHSFTSYEQANIAWSGWTRRSLARACTALMARSSPRSLSGIALRCWRSRRAATSSCSARPGWSPRWVRDKGHDFRPLAFFSRSGDGGHAARS